MSIIQQYSDFVYDYLLIFFKDGGINSAIFSIMKYYYQGIPYGILPLSVFVSSTVVFYFWSYYEFQLAPAITKKHMNFWGHVAAGPLSLIGAVIVTIILGGLIGLICMVITTIVGMITTGLLIVLPIILLFGVPSFSVACLFKTKEFLGKYKKVERHD